MVLWQRWRRTCEQREPQVLLIAITVAAALEHADFVVQPFGNAERVLVVRLRGGRNALPVTCDQRGELRSECAISIGVDTPTAQARFSLANDDLRPRGNRSNTPHENAQSLIGFHRKRARPAKDAPV